MLNAVHLHCLRESRSERGLRSTRVAELPSTDPIPDRLLFDHRCLGTRQWNGFSRAHRECLCEGHQMRHSRETLLTTTACSPCLRFRCSTSCPYKVSPLGLFASMLIYDLILTPSRRRDVALGGPGVLFGPDSVCFPPSELIRFIQSRLIQRN